MPELPEVETVRLILQAKLKDTGIEDVKVYYPKIINGDISYFREKIKKQHFRSFFRRGKYLLFLLDDFILVSHLRMEGKFYYFQNEPQVDKHTHLLFKLSNNAYLAYHDVRKFGRLQLLSKDININSFLNLGPEPFEEDFNLDYMAKSLAKYRNKTIKEVLLNQHFVAGIGNIYADESLFKAKINPLTRASYLNKNELKSLKEAIVSILNKAIEKGGTTIRSFTSQLGITGHFQLQLAVYGKKNELCSNCLTPIKKIIVGGRGTHFCPSCQKQKLRIAISGSFGSGKSSVLYFLKEAGYAIFDCDEENKKLLATKEVITKLKAICPACIKNERVDKITLSRAIFANKNLRLKVQKILHTLLLAKIEERSKDERLLFVEVPLLFEVKWQKYFDHNLLITCDKKTSLKRLKDKGYSLKEIKERCNAQLKEKDKVALAEEVIVNNQKIELLKERILEWVKKYDC